MTITDLLAPASTSTAVIDRSEVLAGLRTGKSGRVHSWELVTAVDGPGTRMTLFLAGCPLRCLYCHNPDTWQGRNGTAMSVQDVMARITRYEGVFRATGGGVTISGGEPLQQSAFVERLARQCAAQGISVALDTSGYLGAKASDALLSDLDLVLLDVKSGLTSTYQHVTGVQLEPTLEFGRRLAQHGKRIWLRFVLVPGLTDAPENVAAVADYAASLGVVERVEVLAFHQMGQEKWRELGLAYQLRDTPAPSTAQVEQARAIFRSNGLVAL